MSNTSKVANSLLNDMLQETTLALETELKIAIEGQLNAYKRAQKETFRKVLGESSSAYDLIQHFKYQSSIRATLTEMQNTYLEYFGKPWDYEEPAKPKRGRPRKSK